MRLSVWLLVLVAVGFVCATGCDNSHKPTAQEQQKTDDDMRKAMDANKQQH